MQNNTAKRPTRTFAQFFGHVKALGFYPQTVIDVGVARGTPELYASFPNAYLVLFEPLADFRADLERIVNSRPGEYHICALMEAAGTNSIFRTKDKCGSSMMHRIEDPGDSRLEQVQVRTLDQVILPARHKGPLLLKTDCQGGDYSVVRGGVGTLALCEVVIMEVSLFQFWGPHHPNPLDIFNFMSDQGFAIYDILDGLFRPLDAALGQIDVVFVRRDGMFRQSHRWA